MQRAHDAVLRSAVSLAANQMALQSDNCDLAAIDDLARRLSNLVPPGMQQAREDLEQNIKATLQMSLSKLELVTREEFDVQHGARARRWTRWSVPSNSWKPACARKTPPTKSRRGSRCP